MIGEHHRLERALFTMLVAISVHHYNNMAALGIVPTIMLTRGEAHEVIVLK